MKNYKFILIVGYFVSFTGISVMVLSYFRESLLIFFIGAVFVILGLLMIVTLMSLNLFVKDKELEIEKLRQMGLTIVVCKSCFKENVLEDQYCIYCGKSLIEETDKSKEENS